MGTISLDQCFPNFEGPKPSPDNLTTSPRCSWNMPSHQRLPQSSNAAVVRLTILAPHNLHNTELQVRSNHQLKKTGHVRNVKTFSHWSLTLFLLILLIMAHIIDHCSMCKHIRPVYNFPLARIIIRPPLAPHATPDYKTHTMSGKGS